MKKFTRLHHELFEDEGLDFPIVYLLRVRGHKVIYAAEEYVSATDV